MSTNIFLSNPPTVENKENPEVKKNCLHIFKIHVTKKCVRLFKKNMVINKVSTYFFSNTHVTKSVQIFEIMFMYLKCVDRFNIIDNIHVFFKCFDTSSRYVQTNLKIVHTLY